MCIRDSVRIDAASRKSTAWLATPNSTPMCAWMPNDDSFARNGRSDQSDRAVIVEPAGSTATLSSRIGQVLSTWAADHAVPGSAGVVISSGPSSPAPRAVSSTRSNASGSTGPVDPVVPPCSACSPDPLAAAPPPGSAVSSTGAFASSAVSAAVKFSPAYVDQVSPVADRNKAPSSTHTPMLACHDRVRRTPLAPFSGTSSALTRRRAFRRRPSHKTSPPNEITHSQLAASSEYSVPGTPRFRLLCRLSSQVVAGVEPNQVVSCPRTRAV